MGKPTSTIAAAQVHSILKQFNYDFVPADPDRALKKSPGSNSLNTFTASVYLYHHRCRGASAVAAQSVLPVRRRDTRHRHPYSAPVHSAP